jgi:hypothetical protein
LRDEGSNVKRDRRLQWLAAVLLALAAATEVRAFDPHRFQPLRAAASTMKVAAAHDVTYDRFSELALQLAVELLAMKGAARSDEDRALLLLYARAGLAYGDSLTLWREKVQVQHTDALSKEAPSIKPLIERYDLPVDAEGTVGADAAIHSLWKQAAKALAKAELFYSGRLEEIAVAVNAERRGSESPREPQPKKERSAAENAAQRIALIERVAQEFDHAEREAERPKPYEAAVGNWTCPRGYVLRQGRCFSDAEIARMPKVEISP